MSEELETLLSEYLDGRLDAAGRRRVEALLEADPALARRLRLMRAMRGALRASAVPAPAPLKAALRARAQERASRPSWLAALKEALQPKPWAFGAASAFAAALIVLSLRREPPHAPRTEPASVQSWTEGESYRELGRELWSDDEGGDDEA